MNTNIEAAKEIPRQLRLRNLGGIIIIDFIDMRLEEDKKKVLDTLEENLSKDRIKNNIVHFTDLGLIEMTRKRTGKPLYHYFQEKCPICNGTGKVKSKEAVIHDLLKEIKSCCQDRDISAIKVILSKKLKIAFQETYYDFALEYAKNKKKKILLEDNNQNDYSFTIILMK